MSRIKLTIQYVGTAYSGWQYQENARTVQDEMQKALSQILNESVTLYGVGRTDEGVHAESYVAHFDTSRKIALSKIVLGANRYLPPDISVLNAEEVHDGFDARYDAKSKTYVYRLYASSARMPLLDWNHTQVYKMPDIELMKKGAKMLEGVHDFAAFQSTGSNLKGTVREVYKIEIIVKGNVIEIYVTGNAFLYNMVRNISGCLLWLGQGKLTLEDISYMLENKSRPKHFKTLPSKGLTMVGVEY
jgi:tRNA pseudouridine38-40 synthase